MKALILAALAVTTTLGAPATAQDAEDGRIGTGLECVPFARQVSGIQIFGDAWTWWNQASGRYAEGATPKVGAVLVFRPYGVMKLGHVAVVSRIVSDRILMVTHARHLVTFGTRHLEMADGTVREDTAFRGPTVPD